MRSTPVLSYNRGEGSLILVLGDIAGNSTIPSAGSGRVLASLLGGMLGVLEFLSSNAANAVLLDEPPGGCRQLFLGSGGADSVDMADFRFSERADLDRVREVPSSSWVRLSSH